MSPRCLLSGTLLTINEYMCSIRDPCDGFVQCSGTHSRRLGSKVLSVAKQFVRACHFRLLGQAARLRSICVAGNG